MYPEGIVCHEFVTYLCLDSPLFYLNHFECQRPHPLKEILIAVIYS